MFELVMWANLIENDILNEILSVNSRGVHRIGSDVYNPTIG